MTIGGSIALIILGAILAFAVEVDLAGVDLNTIGYILMIGGAVGMLFGLIRLGTTRRVERPAERTVVEDRDPL